MTCTILDCYTDEPAGLGVPPYLGVYPRYIAGYYEGDVNYLTIDDLRFYNLNKRLNKKNKKPAKKEIKTNIRIYNRTRVLEETEEILKKTTKLIIIAGVHTPGKYLSAVPGTLKEISYLVKELNCEKILTGPALFGTQLEGGKFFEKIDLKQFKIKKFDFKYSQIKDYALKGSIILKQIPSERVIEIETGHGCSRKESCSFCTEPLKNKLEFREKKDIIKEVKEFYNLGARYFRLGKQSCFYTIPKPIELLKDIRKSCNNLKVLHIDNVNPVKVIDKKGIETTKAIVKYCTPGNVAAFGVESFDENVCSANKLNTRPKLVHAAVKILNKYGAERGNNGMPNFLPGINLLFGLKEESKETFEKNYYWLKRFLDENLLLRRINIRQVSIFEGTELFNSVKNKFIKKNKKHYWKSRNKIRQDIDFNMLKKLVPKGTILKNVRTEIHDGNTTFARQFGTYPLIVGIKERLELGKFYNIKVKDYMLRSVVGEVV